MTPPKTPEDIPLLQHLMTVMDERDLRYQQRFEAQELAMLTSLRVARDAVAKAEAATNERLALLNEFRGQAEQQAKEYPRAETVNARFLALEKDHGALSARIERGEGRSGGLTAGWGYLVGSLTLVLALAGVIVAIVVH
jgi:hypothetical protein